MRTTSNRELMTPAIDAALKQFLTATPQNASGGIMTDLDGTAVHEVGGRITIPEKVAVALKTLNDAGRPALINSLRLFWGRINGKM